MRKHSRLLALLCALLCAATFCLSASAWAEDAPPLKHYLVLGLDYYTVLESISARTDVVLLVTLDQARNRILCTSILRDCKVTTPGGMSNKLNTVYSNYGMEGVKSTIERQLQLSVDGVILLDFEAIKLLIDELGGVDIEISLPEYRWIHSILQGNDPDMPQSPGLTHMTGRIALAYMRDRRSGGSDFARVEHQRKVLVEMMRKVSELSLSDTLRIFNTLSSRVGTDMSMPQMAAAVQSAYGLRNAELVGHRVPADRTFSYGTLRGSSVLNVNWKQNRRILQSLFYPEEENNP